MTEELSFRELRRRLRELYTETCHLRDNLPVDSPYAHILRTQDVARWIPTTHYVLLFYRFDEPPPKCKHACPTVDSCRRKVNCRSMEPKVRQRLDEFFRGWDAGTIVKVRVVDHWEIRQGRHALALPDVVGRWNRIRPTTRDRYPALAPVVTPARPQVDSQRPVIRLTIDRSTLGLKVGK